MTKEITLPRRRPRCPRRRPGQGFCFPIEVPVPGVRWEHGNGRVMLVPNWYAMAVAGEIPTAQILICTGIPYCTILVNRIVVVVIPYPGQKVYKYIYSAIPKRPLIWHYTV